MKNVFILILFFLLIIEGIWENNSYNYNSYNEVSKNSNLSKNEITSTESDQSAVYITTSGIIISDATIQKSSGDSSNTKNSEFYGVNAAVLVQGGEVTIIDGTITTGAKGANAICATNGGSVSISGTTITSTFSSSARGLHATFGVQLLPQIFQFHQLEAHVIL